jgi:hypothetical protein
MSQLDLYKYPRTHHIEGSRLQPGDEDLSAIPFEHVRGHHLVVEEKMDGANAAISFSPEGRLQLQSRGHYLTGGGRERHFNLFKQWANTHAHVIWPVLSDRYILYGEWLYAWHTIFYNDLPHYFMEFDILDKTSGDFLSTERRHAMLEGLPMVSVKVLAADRFNTLNELTDLIGASHFIRGDHLADLAASAANLGLDAERAMQESDRSTLMEGLYIKAEEEGIVRARYKYVRASFLTTVLQSNTHWLSRPIIPNQLAPNVDIFSVLP